MKATKKAPPAFSQRGQMQQLNKPIDLSPFYGIEQPHLEPRLAKLVKGFTPKERLGMAEIYERWALQLRRSIENPHCTAGQN